MAITTQEVERIAALARIALNSQEKITLAGELSAILDFVNQLALLDTRGIAPLTGGTNLVQVIRPDELRDADLQSVAPDLLAAAPSRHNEWVKVRQVFE